MYRLFTRPLTNIGETNSPSMVRIRALIWDHYTYQQDYYRHFGFYVASHHILMRLAYVLNIYLDTEVDTYRMINDNLHNICSGLGITSDYTPGHVFHDAFYTKTCLILATNFSDSDPNQVAPLVWQNIRAVRCLTHPNTSMEVHVPVTNKRLLGEGLAAVGIDIPLFGYQLKQWLIINNNLPEIEQESLAQFLSKYVLPGMVMEQIDIALRNRLSYIYKDTIPSVITKERSFVTTSEASLVAPLQRILEVINTSRAGYKKALLEIPMIFENNYFTAVPMEIASPSSYSYYVILLVMIDWVYPMTIFIEADQKNITEIGKVLKRVERFVNGTNCLKYIPSELKPEFERKYNRIKEVYRQQS